MGTGRIENLWWYRGLPPPSPPTLGRHRTQSERERIGFANSLHPSVELTPEFCLLLGIIWGDGTYYSLNGSSYVRISCGLSEPLANECVVLFRNVGLNPHKYLDESPTKRNWKPQWMVQVYSSVLVRWLQQLSLQYLRDSLHDELASAFWQGMSRAEGHLHKDRGLSISNTNEGLMRWGCEVLGELGYHPTFHKVFYRKHPHWRPRCDIYIKKSEVASFKRGTFLRRRSGLSCRSLKLGLKQERSA